MGDCPPTRVKDICIRCRFLARCGDSLGVESSFQDICIFAAVLNSRRASNLWAVFTSKEVRGAVMGLFRDRARQRDLSLKLGRALAVWLMTQQLRCDVNAVLRIGSKASSYVVVR